MSKTNKLMTDMCQDCIYLREKPHLMCLKDKERVLTKDNPVLWCKDWVENW